MNLENAVLERYTQGARQRVDALCCPVEYDKELLKLLPAEVIERDYGCGDPSRYVMQGDTVLDLGSGSGKVCYLAALLAGHDGEVIGVDMNDEMLTLARKYQVEMAAKVGNDRVRFVKGYIQDLALDVDAMQNWLAVNPVTDALSLGKFEHWKSLQREQSPLIASDSIDLVISNCVLNLVDDTQKRQLVSEIYRVVKPGGRVAISDIVSDETVPAEMKQDEKLWSGCISGAFGELEFLESFREAGFQAVCYDKWSAEPWQVVDGIEFRSVTITAIKGEGAECIDRGHAVIYRGPFSRIHDDDGHAFPRGQRIAVCARTFRMLTESPAYRDHFIGISPQQEPSPRPWCAPAGTLRPARETRGGVHKADPVGSCC